jgi:lipid-A-disaccharide synthase
VPDASPSLLIVAGDPSGDAHAARLVAAVRARLPSLDAAALGGPALRQAGVRLLDDLTQASAIGPFDAARFLGRFRRARDLFRQELDRRRPDLVVLVDFGDFNLPVIAPLAKRRGVPVLYYISPQIWAWGRWRLRLVRRYVDRMVVFFPFEEAFYRGAGIPVTWVGHPLVDHAHPRAGREEALRRFGLNPWRRVVGLLPGSRAQEVRRHLPLMVEAAAEISRHMPGVQFLLPRAPGIRISAEEVARVPQIRLAEGPIYDALSLMESAVVASGTSTLEAAVCGVPIAVVYRTSWPTFAAARAVMRVPHIAMVNLLAGRRLVTEFVQHRARPKAIAHEVMRQLRDEEYRRAILQGLAEVAAKLGPPGATERAAEAVRQLLTGYESGGGSTAMDSATSVPS